MSYATPADFEATYGTKESIQLSNRGNAAATTVDDTVLQRFIDAASGIIDSYLAGRYNLPLTPVQAEPLMMHCLRLARCEADNISTRDKCQADCDRTYEWLRDVALGRIELGKPGLPQQPDLNESVSGQRMVFRGKVQGQSIDLEGF
jgi:phage gp36-like protein